PIYATAYATALLASRRVACQTDIGGSDRSRLAPLVLQAAEQDLALLGIEGRLAALVLLQHLDAALHRRPGGDALEPALIVGVFRGDHALALRRAHPGPAGDVGDRVLAGEIVAIGQPPVDHAIEPPRLLGVAVDRVADLLRRIKAEMMGL